MDWPYCYKCEKFIRPDQMMGEICIQCRIAKNEESHLETLSAGIIFRKPKRKETSSESILRELSHSRPSFSAEE